MIRALWMALLIAPLTVLYGGRIILASLRRAPHLPCLCERISRRWCRAILRVSGVRVRLVGQERLPDEGPVVVVSNHQSWYDVFALVAHFPRLPRFVAKEELASIPVFGQSWRACGHISIKRQDRSEAIDALEKAGDLMRDEDAAVLMFAEGTRSPTGELQPFKKGAFVLAIQAGVPVLPVAVVGSREVMPKGSFRIRPGEIEIRVGELIPVEGLAHRDRDDLRDRAWEAVARLKGEPSEPLRDADGGKDAASRGVGDRRGGGVSQREPGPRQDAMQPKSSRREERK